MSNYGNYPITEEYKAKVLRGKAESIANSVKSRIKEYSAKSNLTRRTSEELKEARCSAYEYLIP